MARHWLSGLLRARQAQEDAAAQQLAAAERAARRAAARVRYDRDRLDSLRTADALYDAPVFVAATHAAAVQVAEHSARVVEERRDDLIDAARARRSAEELHERQLHEASAKARRIAQGELDEVAARVHRDPAAGENA
jgi:hypothetical protein